ncbi:MAG: Na+/H+ antiporter subunit C [Thermaurantiacus sp.]
MEALISIAIGLMMGAGVWLVLRPGSFSVVLGITMMAYAVNFLIFAGGRLDRTSPPLTLEGSSGWADPLPQALVLTAIVIGFGMTAFLVALALRAMGETGSDAVDAGVAEPAEQDDPEERP